MSNKLKRVIALLAVFCFVFASVPMKTGTVKVQAADEYQYFFWSNGQAKTVSYEGSKVTINCKNGVISLNDTNIQSVEIHGQGGVMKPVTPGAISLNIVDTLGGGYEDYAVILTTTKNNIKANITPDSGYIAGVYRPVKGSTTDEERYTSIKPGVNETLEMGYCTLDDVDDHMDINVNFEVEKFYPGFDYCEWDVDGNTFTFIFEYIPLNDAPACSIKVKDSQNINKWDDGTGFNIEVEKSKDALIDAFTLGSAFTDNPEAALLFSYWDEVKDEPVDLGILKASGFTEIQPISNWPEGFSVGVIGVDDPREGAMLVTLPCEEDGGKIVGNSVYVDYVPEEGGSERVVSLSVSAGANTELVAYSNEDWQGDGTFEGVSIWVKGNNISLTYTCDSNYTFESGYRYITDDHNDDTDDYDDTNNPNLFETKTAGTFPVTLKDGGDPDVLFFIWVAYIMKKAAPAPVIISTPDPVITSAPATPTPAPTTPTPAPTTPTPTPEVKVETEKKDDGTEVKTTVTTNADGSKETETETVNADGTKEIETVTENKDGSVKTETVELDAKGNVLSKTEEEVSVSSRGTEIVETKIENADGSSKESVVKTTKEGKVVSETVEIDANGELSITLETDKTDGSEVVKTFEKAADDGIKLTDYDTKGKTAVVPGEIKIGDITYVVTTIGKKTMAGNTDIKKITLPESITTIGKGAFQNAKKLKKIVLGSVIESVSKNAFKGIAKNAKFYIKASEKDFERIVGLIRDSGVDASVKFVRVEP